MRDLTIYTDGSVYPNPNGIGGWAFVVPEYDEDGEGILKPYEYWGYNPRTTNNRMELIAAIQAMSMVERGGFATIVTDSQYVQRCFARRRWPESKPNWDLGRALMETKRNRFIEIRLVPGHSGDKWNDRAHELANKARLEGVAYEKRRADEEKKFSAEIARINQRATERRPSTLAERISEVTSTMPTRNIWAHTGYSTMSSATISWGGLPTPASEPVPF